MKKNKIIIQILFIILTTTAIAKDYKGGELRTHESFTYGRFEVRMMSAAGSGMLSSFFTYHDEGIAWNEIDIETLGQYDNQVQFNVITPGQVDHVHSHMTPFNPHTEFQIYAFEWTPTYVAWFINDIEVYRDEGWHISELNLAQKIMMNMWIPDYPGWVGEWDDSILPLYAFYDWVKYYEYTPGQGDYGSDNNFSFSWHDNFDNWDQSRWGKATHTWWGNNCDFTPDNVVFQSGFMILCLTDNYNLGFNGVIPSTVTEYLQVLDGLITNSEGEPILLRGLGLGGWLVPEGYMLHIPGYGSPTDIQNRIAELIGGPNTAEFYDLYEQNYVNRNDIQQIAEWGFNSIRLPLHYNKLSPLPGIYLEDGFQQIDSLLSWCAENELYLILDMHCAPGGQNPNNISDSDGVAELWLNPDHQEHTIDLWREIALRYVGKNWIGGYDLLNEPVLPDGYDNSHLRDLYVNIRNAIREVDEQHVIYIEGNWYATDFNLLSPPFDGNMVYTFHKYWNEVTQSSIDQYIALREAYNVPLWLGETGENSNHWFAETVALMENNNIGWNWWTHKKLDTITSPLSADIPSGFQAILDFWNDDGPQPATGEAFDGLMQLAENLHIDSCSFHSDVLAALMDEDFTTLNQPFADNIIPGEIQAVNYDLGSNGVGSNDLVFWKTEGLFAEDWNNGHKFRNDGVDIETSSGASSSVFNIGWTENGEWLEYTVNIQFTGIYNISFTVSSPDYGHNFQLLLDGSVLIDNISVPSTGGWQNWLEINVPGIELAAGEHILQLLILEGGFNISRLNFTSDYEQGDINCDGIVNVSDIVLIVDLILFTEPTEYQLWSADQNGDGTLDILDILMLLENIMN